MEAMKISKRFYAFGILACIAIYVAYIKWHMDSKPMSGVTDGTTENKGDKLDHQTSAADLSVFYGIMFDAGSTGTRIHIFKFTQKSKETPKLTHETFKALKPGLSAYADDVDKVKEIFQASPFFVRDDCVSIMNGTDEGVSAWITINFLTGNLNVPRKRSVGMLDLGGGSTQITFLPSSKTTLQTSPAGHLAAFQMFNNTYKLYSYSYLGLGLMSARLAILGGVEGKPLKEGEELISSCLSPGFKTEWEHAEIVYRVKGQKAGEPLYESCSNKVAKMLYKKVYKAEEVKDLDFYAFSYYYDCAAEVSLIDKEKGGSLTVSDFETAAKYVCKTMEVSPGDNPFLCMDLTYISVLLQELGFPKSQVFKLARKIDDIETSWALGATFHYIDSLNRLQY
ncbi:ectonucleoside triphosphate diphosphohydrolase 6 isoform X2 [Alligator mississippiensis]|uniref:ectonucleoside triphosphate diphosphohydrolase 6 isoform X2 n=1 Tax=Alligator mississippiensis TaxID=8496 RepID=UPI002877CBD2|nr:ectonucleoside triphosphate diphosphohydrolase 6 isoform X2 [Alligator mississippiensis]